MGWLVLEDAQEHLRNDVDSSLLPEYRLSGTCGRVAFRNNTEGVLDPYVEAFVLPKLEDRSVVLFDSTGRVMDVLGMPDRPLQTAQLLEQAARAGSVRYEVGSDGGPALVTDRGRLNLRGVLPDGEWYARPPGIRYGGDLVVVHVCAGASYPTQMGNRPYPCYTDASPRSDDMTTAYEYVHMGAESIQGGATVRLVPIRPYDQAQAAVPRAYVVDPDEN